MNTCTEGFKRQLPPWMLQKKVIASDVSNSDNAVETSCIVENGDIAANDGDATKKIDRKRKTLKRESNLDSKCEVKRRRNLRQQEGIGDNDVQTKKKRANRCRDEIHESCSHDETDLTVEDLMAIAEQYVKDHENEDQQDTPGGRYEPELQIPSTSESGTALDYPFENPISSSSAREALDNSTGQLVTTSTSQTENLGQDMLDLLLGPLLRNLPEKEKNNSILDS